MASNCYYRTNSLINVDYIKIDTDTSNTFEEKSYERDLNFLSIKELVYIEQATKIVCQKYRPDS